MASGSSAAAYSAPLATSPIRQTKDGRKVGMKLNALVAPQEIEPPRVYWGPGVAVHRPYNLDPARRVRTSAQFCPTNRGRAFCMFNFHPLALREVDHDHLVHHLVDNVVERGGVLRPPSGPLTQEIGLPRQLVTGAVLSSWTSPLVHRRGTSEL
jgi:hypothetical protein